MKRFLSVVLCATLLLALMSVLPQTASAKNISTLDIQVAEPVASYAINYKTVLSDSSVVAGVTWKENSPPSFTATLKSGDEYRAGIAYKVEIWLRVIVGNWFDSDRAGNLLATFTVNGKPATSVQVLARDSQNDVTEVMVTYEFPSLAGSELSRVYITGIPTPVEGQMPIYSFSLGSNSYAFYHTEPVVWWDQTTGKQMDSSDTFIKGHEYQLNIWLRANREGGFTFKVDQYDNPQVNVVLNSWSAHSVTRAYEQEGREVIDIRYTFPPCQAAHTCAPKLVPLQKQTCVMPGFKAYYECTCGKYFEDAAGKKEITDIDGYGIIPADGHKEGAWSYNGTHHYKKCTTCREVIPGTNAAHIGGTATCIQQAKCTDCGASYGKLDADHRWGPGWDYKDASGHAWVCADCKTHSQIQAHKPGPAATESTPQKCTDCGYVIQPAKNHTHKLTQVEKKDPSCTAAGNIGYYLCDGCGKLFSDAKAQEEITGSVQIPVLEHEADEKWTNDDMNHWKACRYCQIQLTETVQLHQADGNNCSVCGYAFSGGNQDQDPENPGTEPEEPETKPTVPEDKEQPAKEESIPGWAIALMIGLICFGASIVATVLIIKKKK